LMSNFGMLYIMITRHTYEIHKSSALWLLPVVPSIVCGISGAIVADALASVSIKHALLTTLVAAFLLALGLTMSLSILVVYIQRLILHGFPDSSLSASLFLPLGPLGQGGYGMMLVGNLFVTLLPQSSPYIAYLPTEGVAVALGSTLFLLSVVLWVFGMWFLIPASIALASSRKVTFGLPWWGLIFPTAIYTLLTVEIGEKLDCTFIRVVAAVYTVLTFLLTAVISAGTIHLIWNGSIFHDICLDDASPLNPVEVKEGGSEGLTVVEIKNRPNDTAV